MDISDDLFALFFLMPVVEGLKDRNLARAMPANAVGGEGKLYFLRPAHTLAANSFPCDEDGKRRMKD